MSSQAQDGRSDLWSFVLSRFRCPDCMSVQLPVMDSTIRCSGCGTVFPVLDGRPVLLSSHNELFPRSGYDRSGRDHVGARERSWSRLLPSRSVNLAYRRNIQGFIGRLEGLASADVLVIGAAHQREALTKLIGNRKSLRLMYSDVDIAADVDLYCDGHELPFQDQTFDGVIASAVLEHVLNPTKVVAELYRILRPNGLIYSEIPFLQQVHEGAYDFTRFTLSGHRRLLNQFSEIASGVVAGPATTLSWALEHFAVSCAPSNLAPFMRLSARLAFFWLKYLDYLFGQRPSASDGASCTFFLGARSARAVTDADIVARYSGTGTTTHL